MSDNVVYLSDRRPDEPGSHLACKCGNVWLDTSVVIEDGKVTGYAVPLHCKNCDSSVRP